jgi:hypothetical protein
MNDQQLKDAIQKYFSDKSRSREATREGLEAARDEIEMLLETLSDE